MLKKSLSVSLSAALLITGPARGAVEAAANVARPVSVPRLSAPTMGAFSAPSLAPMAPSLLGAPALSLSPALNAPSVAPLAAAPLAAAPVAAPATAPTALLSVTGAAEALTAPNAAPAAQTGVLNGLYEGTERTTGFEAFDVLGQAAANDAPSLSPASETPAASRRAVPSASVKNGGLLMEVGIGAAVIAVVALVSKPFRDILARVWNATLGKLSIFAKKAETPEVLAQRIIDQLNAARPVYNQKVEQASTLVEKLKLQIASEKAKVAELETNITALLSDSDATNDILASGMINQQKTLTGSILASEEQLKLSEAGLQDIKDERTRFFAEREETIAKINAKLTQAKAAEIKKQLAELKGGFQIGDLKDNLDRLDSAVNDKIASANGAADSVASNPDEILKKAKDSVKNAAVLEEIERRKKEIAEKAAKKNGGALNSIGIVGIVFIVIGLLNNNIGLFLLGVMFTLLLGQDSNRRNGGELGLLGIAGIAAGVVGLLALVSAPFRDILARLWNATLGKLSIFAKKAETPEVLAQRIIDQLNAARPVYNQKVEQASTLVEKLKLQIASQKEKSAELDANVTALLSDSDPTNDLMASTLLNQKATIDASTAASEEQLTLSQAALQNIKDERTSFFAEREETIAKINAKLTQAKAAEIKKQLAELKGGFQIGDLKDNLDRLDSAVNDKIASANGAADSVASNPDEILKKAKDSVKNAAVLEEIERRKKEIAEKAAKKNGGRVHPMMIFPVLVGLMTPALLVAALMLAPAAAAPIILAIGLPLIGLAFVRIFDPLILGTAPWWAGDVGSLGKKLDVVGLGLFGLGWVAASQLPASLIMTAFPAALAVFVLARIVKYLRAGRQAPPDAAEKNGGALPSGRDLSMGELLTLNLVGMAAAVAAGFYFSSFLIGLVGLYVAPIPFIYGYVALMRLTGSAINIPGLRFAPSFTWAGKQHRLPSDKNGGLLMEVGIGAAVVAVVALLSKPFRDILARVWNATLGKLSLFAKKAETPEVLAQRIIDQLNAARPVYNQKVEQASTLVEKLKLQIASEKEKVADLETSVTALLSDSDPNNDVMAAGLLNQQKTLQGSIAASEEQLTLSQTTLQAIKDERTSFFAEREETIAKINAKLTQAKAAEIKKQLAELKGGFQIGDLKDNLDRLDSAVNDKIASANGAADSVASNPDEILKKAKDSVKNAAVLEEIERRKKEIAEKAAKKNGGSISQGAALGLFAKAIGIGFALAMPIVASLVAAGAGLLALALPSENGRAIGRQLGVIGLGTLILGGLPMALGVKFGFLGIATFGGSFAFLIPGGLALMAGILVHLKANSSDAKVADSVPQATAPVAAPAPVATTPSAPAEVAAPSKGASFSIKPLLDVMARLWNAFLGALGIGVRKLETPEILAQRIIDQLNAAKLSYNNKVKDASTLVESLKLQIQKQKADSAKLDEAVNILLSDKDTTNDLSAAGILNQKKTLDASTAATEEQLGIAAQGLQGLKEDRARFFAEREETMAKIASKLTAAKAAEIKREMAALKGGFSIGDLKDNIDRLDSAVNDRVASANGAADAVASNPDEILNKAKQSARSAEVDAELERRKKDIAEKAAKKNGGQIPGYVWLGVAAGAIAQLAALMSYGFAAALPYIGIMGWSGLIAGAISQFVPEAKKAAGIGAAAGLALAALSAVASPATILLGLAAGGFVGWFASAGEKKGGIGGFMGAALGGMMIGVTLPAWLGALGMKALLDKAANRDGGAVGLGLLPLAGLTGLAALGTLFIGGAAGFVIGAALGYVYLDFISSKKNTRDLNDLFLGVIAYGVLGAVLTAIGSVLYFI